MNRRKQTRKSRNSGQNSTRTTDLAIAQSAQVVGKAFVNTPRQDFSRRTPNWLLTQTPPRDLTSQIFWVRGKRQAVITVSNTVPTEMNFPFAFSDLPNLVGVASYFDQYSIYSVVCNVTCDFEGAGSTLYSFGTCVTAIDYDNVNNLGSLASIESYGSAVTQEFSTGQSIQRYVKPCVAPALYTSGATFSGYGVQRQWIDSASTGVPHYGFRTFFVSNTVSGLSATADFSYVIGLRNNI